MIESLQFLALFATALFAGAALYINLVEHPARMRLPPGAAAAAQWAPSYARATWMQAPLTLLGCVAGLGVWFPGRRLGLVRRCRGDWRCGDWRCGAVHIHRDHADEPPVAGARARSRFRGNTRLARTLESAARRADRIERGCPSVVRHGSRRFIAPARGRGAGVRSAHPVAIASARQTLRICSSSSVRRATWLRVPSR